MRGPSVRASPPSKGGRPHPATRSPREGRSLAAAAPILSVQGLSKSFPQRRGWRDLASREPVRWHHAVDDVSFDVHRGEVFGLLGPNGAGKTTLLKMLSTLILPDRGEVTVEGHDLRVSGHLVRRVVSPVIADERSLNWRLSARENLRFFGALHGIAGAELSRKIDELLEIVDLGDTGDKLAGAFSSGMRQRLLIARALLARPRLLLLDEPTRSLDPVAARDFRLFLRRDLTRDAGCSILMATHEPEEGLELCDRVAVLHRGRLIASGTPRDLMATVSGRTYRLWTRHPDHPAVRALSPDAVGHPVPSSVDPGWHELELELSDPSEALRYLVSEGVDVGRFERMEPTLADLLEALSGAAPS